MDAPSTHTAPPKTHTATRQCDYCLGQGFRTAHTHFTNQCSKKPAGWSKTTTPPQLRTETCSVCHLPCTVSVNFQGRNPTHKECHGKHIFDPAKHCQFCLSALSNTSWHTHTTDACRKKPTGWTPTDLTKSTSSSSSLPTAPTCESCGKESTDLKPHGVNKYAPGGVYCADCRL